MREVFLLGVGATSFRPAGRAGEHLARQAGMAAVADAGLRECDVSAMIVATGAKAGDAAGREPQDLGIGHRTHHPDRAPPCESGAAALHLAWQAVARGAHDVVLCLGRECRPAGAPPPREPSFRVRALAAERYMRASGATVGHFARVAAKNRAQGADNPRALLTTAVDPAAVLASELLVWPLRRLMVAPPSEGAAAVVLASGDVGRRIGARAPRVRCSVLAPDGDDDPVAAAARAARRAYQAAAVAPEEVDCAEVDDGTAAAEVAAYEALQFAPDGQGPELVESGFTARGGVLPVNPSGGSLAQGDAAGVAGIAQLCELAWQLRGEADRRQVAGARVALALSNGATDAGEPFVSVTILTAG